MKIISTCLIFILLTYYVHIIPVSGSCGYDSCDPGKPDKLNVHIIAHTHDDVGWLKTVDQYYYGYRDNIQGAGVQYILDTVVSALWQNPNRKFSYVEMSFFYRWWKEQKDDIRDKVRQLVNQGRLQFLLGGWCMNDEATVHYTAIIDQMSLGLDFLNKTFGECGRPLVSWQIDPFGHSIEQANLFADMGFDSLYFWRLDYRDKQQRIESQRMEFIQLGTFLGPINSTKLFTSILFESYCTPPGFCFDDKCNDDPIMDDPSLNDYNVQKRVDDFANYVLKQAKAYQTNHILVPMGCDFQFQNAFHNFVNIDKLIYHVNRLRKDINVMYSTPACHTLAVNKAKKKYTVKVDDFFPYASDVHSYWTGYFSSRPSLKGFVRHSNNVFQVCKQVHVLSQQNRIDLNKKVNFMAMKMGVLQHHDAVSGTAKQHVTFDYEQRLDKGVKSCQDVINSSLSKLISKETVDYNFVTCNLLNISYCAVSDNIIYNRPLTILLYNPLGQAQSFWNRIPVQKSTGEGYSVTQSNGNKITSQLIPITDRTKLIPERPKESISNFELIFHTVVPPIGYTSITVKRLKMSTCSYQNSITKHVSSEEEIVIQNQFLKLTYGNGFLKKIFNKKANIDVNIKQDLRYYISSKDPDQPSGAYIFRPTTNESLSINEKPKLIQITGTVVSEIHQIFSSWGTLVTRLYNNSDKIETEWTVGPIPIDDSNGREVVLQYQTNLDNENVFYTDSNARQMTRRTIDFRYDYKFSQTEPVAGNFYPTNSHVCFIDVKNKTKSLIIYLDRAEAVGAYRNGMVEIMVHRRTLKDDHFGVGEPLNETGMDGKGLIVRGKHWISFDVLALPVINNMRTESLKIFNKPLQLFTLNSNKTIPNYSSILSSLPYGINLLSLENHYNLNNEIDYQILRVENIMYFSNKPIQIDLKQLFKSLSITNVEELNLSANQFLKDVHRLHWDVKKENDQKVPLLNGSVISLYPAQIRTFKVQIRSK